MEKVPLSEGERHTYYYITIFLSFFSEQSAEFVDDES